jgi:hypothetical protein
VIKVEFTHKINNEAHSSMITTQYRQCFIGLLFSIMTVLSSCADIKHAQSDTSNELNQAAQQYVKLGLELGEYDKDYVDAYLGPDEWKKMQSSSFVPSNS